MTQAAARFAADATRLKRRDSLYLQDDGNDYVFSLFGFREQGVDTKEQRHSLAGSSLKRIARSRKRFSPMPTNEFATNPKSTCDRLDTPASAGYRAGMSSSGMIGRWLGRLYGLPDGTPREIGNALQVLDRKAYRAD